MKSSWFIIYRAKQEKKERKRNFDQSKHFAVISRKSVCVQQVSELVVPSDFMESRGNTGPYAHMNCPGVTAWRVWVQGLHWQATCWQTHTCSDTFCRPWLRKTQWLVFLEERHPKVFTSLAASPPVPFLLYARSARKVGTEIHTETDRSVKSGPIQSLN